MKPTVETFKEYVSTIEAREEYYRPIAFGVGLRKRKKDKTLEVFFPHINFQSAFGTAAVLQDIAGFFGNENGYAVLSHSDLTTALGRFDAFAQDNEVHPNIELLKTFVSSYQKVDTYAELDILVYFLFDDDSPVIDAEEGYFKIQCLSQLHARPHAINCGGIFGKMNNVAWTNLGPMLPEDLINERIKATFRGQELVVSHVDKFPYMVNFHIPDGVRIVQGSKVRLGAHLNKGTTVMPAGFVNFNAGTLGNAMVEGRISAGVVVGEDSDIGGGASIMGTLSGGNKHVISIGKQCLLGANAGTGISLGDGCTIAAGAYVTAAAKIALYDDQKRPINLKGDLVEEGKNVVKGYELDGKSYLLYLQDSETGKLIARPNSKLIELNQTLHA